MHALSTSLVQLSHAGLGRERLYAPDWSRAVSARCPGL